MKFTGICKAVLPQQTGQSQRTGQPWVSQEYVFEEEGQRSLRQYAQKASVQTRLPK